MGWLRLVGSLKLYVSLENIGLFYRALLQKRPIILRSLLSICKIDLHIYKMYIRKRDSGIWAWVYIHKRPGCIYERDLCICKRDLHICRRDRQTQVGKSRLAYPIPKKQRDLGVHAKETYIHTKKTYVYVKETYMCAKEIYKSRLAYRIPKKQRDLGVHAKETYIYTKETYANIKET